MYPDGCFVRAPRETATCDGCGRCRYWPALLLRPDHRGSLWRHLIRVCGDCFPHIYLLSHPDVCAAVHRHGDAHAAWQRHVGALLFDQVRLGLPEPANLAELVRWLQWEHQRQVRIARGLASGLGAGLVYEPPVAVGWVLAACTGRLIA